MRHFFIFRHRWAPMEDSQWPFFSFLARRDKDSNALVVPYMEENDDGSLKADPFGIKRVVVINELTQIGSQAVQGIKHTINGEECKLTVYTQDMYKARAQPLLEGTPLEVIFEDEIVRQGNVFSSPIGPMWEPVLQLQISKSERVRGRDDHPAPLIRYHGTSKIAYTGILKSGLKPTTKLGMVGNDMYYLGHFLKALRYSFQDSQRDDAAMRRDPVLLRYVVFVKPDEVLRLVKDRSVGGVLETRPMTKDDLEGVPDKNKWVLEENDIVKDSVLNLYTKGMDLDTAKVGPFSVLKRDRPFDSWEDARKALLVGDQEVRPDPTTYFTGAIKVDGKDIPMDMKDRKAFEVDSFWVPVRDASKPSGVRLYSFTKFPEMAVRPEKGIVRLVGAFEPSLPPTASLRDPLQLLKALRSSKNYLKNVLPYDSKYA